MSCVTCGATAKRIRAAPPKARIVVQGPSIEQVLVDELTPAPLRPGAHVRMWG